MAPPEDHLAESGPPISLPFGERAPHDPRTRRERAAETGSVGGSATRPPPTGDPVGAGSVGPNLARRRNRTEFAFLAKSVRYLSLDRLVEFAMASKPDAAPPIFCDEWGPVNVRYWPWRQAQVLIIDDISPLLGSAPTSDHYTHFAALLGGPLRSIGDLLSQGILFGFLETWEVPNSWTSSRQRSAPTAKEPRPWPFCLARSGSWLCTDRNQALRHDERAGAGFSYMLIPVHSSRPRLRPSRRGRPGGPEYLDGTGP